ncbi:hypothetical protein GCK72_007761 [Caenorhabditis remanei]|uniref:Uncharacterized protein n=1 Tax=Caenorhabditis remanei TaxID=31234 RepID=E3M9P1_CAERE|nr:hypothetical protein GCK72_007761 [Caenorhabditis remanei]EFO96153.1 hypothetical protein CRE_14585 [Caenorhabditis remanei]KAF1767802.1 hypothetical protein GCK72_007761 [Caenorhabditis remanei]
MMSMIRLNVLATLDKDSPAEIEALKKRYNDGDGHTMDYVKSNCPYFVDSEAYATGNKTVNSYKVCCEMVDYCSFYVQTWFYVVCGGAVLLIVITLIVAFCCCCKKRGGGGGEDVESIEKSDATEKEDD